MKTLSYPASEKTQAAYEKLVGLWEVAMEPLPSFLQRKLDMHQILSIPQVDQEQVVKLREAREKLSTKGKPAGTINMRVQFDNGKLLFVYTAV